MQRLTIGGRVRAALDAWRYGSPVTPWWLRNVKAGEPRADLPFIWPDWVEGEPVWHLTDFRSYAEEGFQASALIYAAIMYKYRAITAAPLRAYTGPREEPEILPETHPIQKLCARPNQFQSGAAFSGLNVVYMNISGNAYVLPLPLGAKGEKIEALVPLRPDRVYVVPDEGNVIGYVYMPHEGDLEKAVPFLAGDLLHAKLPNPLDQYEGMGEGLSPIAPMARSGDVDSEITRYLKRFFERGAMPPGALTFDVPMTRKQMDEARERWREVYGGVDNWAKVAILDQKGKYQRLGLTFNEMGFEAIDSRNEPRMAMVFGVPLILLETRTAMVASTYHNKSEARRMFWDDTFIPELRWYEAEWNDAFKDSDIWLAHDITGVPALQPDPANVRAAMAEAMVHFGCTQNEYRAVLGLPPRDDGDVFLLPLSVEVIPADKMGALDDTEKQPVPAAFGGLPEPPEDEGEEEEPTREEAHEEERERAKERDEIKAAPPAIITGRNHWPEAVKADYWRLSDSVAASYESKMLAAVGRALARDAGATLAILSAHSTAEDELDFTGMHTDVHEYFAGVDSESRRNWRDETLPTLRHLAVARAMQDADLFGVSAAPVKALKGTFDAEAFLAYWFDAYAIEYVDPITASSEMMIRGMIKSAALEGIGPTQLADRFKVVFEKWANDAGHPDTAWAQGRLAFYRRELIARTELVGASNRSAFETLQYYGIQAKEWLTAIDGRERPTHNLANAQVRRTDEPFEVGGELLMHPGDKNASLGNIINCRCTSLPVVRV